MSDEQLFGWASAAPLLGWAALLFAPLGRARAVAAARTVAAAVAAGYVLLATVSLAGAGGPLPDLTTLAGLAAAFSDPRGALIGWVHFLALDLWTGTWEAEEAGRRGVPHAVLVPCLALTLMAGPLGLLAFLAARAAFGRTAEPGPPSAA